MTLAEPTLAFTEQPDDVSAFEGNTVTLHAVASDSGADYQWQWSLNGTAWVNCTSSGSDEDAPCKYISSVSSPQGSMKS